MTRADTAGSYMDHHQNEKLPAPLTTMSDEHLIQARQTNTQTSATAAVTAQTSVCGYYSGASSWVPVSCSKDEYCTLNDALGAAGCCSSGSCVYQFACVPGNLLDSGCDEACQSNDQILKCTDGSATICNSIWWPGTSYIYTSWSCDATTTDIEVYLSTTTYTTAPTASISDEPWVTTSYVPGLFPTTLPSPSTMIRSLQVNTIQDSTELGSHVGKIMAIVVGAFLGIILLTGASMFICLRKRPERSRPGRLDMTNYGYGQPLIQTHQDGPMPKLVGRR